MLYLGAVDVGASAAPSCRVIVARVFAASLSRTSRRARSAVSRGGPLGRHGPTALSETGPNPLVSIGSPFSISGLPPDIFTMSHYEILSKTSSMSSMKTIDDFHRFPVPRELEHMCHLGLNLW